MDKNVKIKGGDSAYQYLKSFNGHVCMHIIANEK